MSTGSRVEMFVSDIIFGAVFSVPERMGLESPSNHLLRHFYNTSENVYGVVVARVSTDADRVYVTKLVASAFRAAFGLRTCQNLGI